MNSHGFSTVRYEHLQFLRKQESLLVRLILHGDSRLRGFRFKNSTQGLTVLQIGSYTLDIAFFINVFQYWATHTEMTIQ